jgi:hypothetical protein
LYGSCAPKVSELFANQINSLKQGVAAGKDLLLLRDEVAALISETKDREFVYSALEQMRAEFRNSDDERSEDLVVDLMTFLVGWCAPHMRL